MISPYPEAASARDGFILARRPPRNALDPLRAHAALVEEERSESGEVVPVATIFLTNRECPWRCLMCDLWRNTLRESVPPGAIATQIQSALASLPQARQLKLYNAGSFFDPKAIPPGDHAAVAELARPFERVIVESHPALVGAPAIVFQDRLSGRLEVAMGLETVHRGVLEKLNKRMTLDSFRRAATFLRENGIAVRVFVLAGLPFLAEGDGLEWTCRSVASALDWGADVVAIIPTRTGNGALDAVAARGELACPRLGILEAAAAFGIGLGRGRVFADLWDLERLRRCERCFPARAERLLQMNFGQRVPPPVACAACGGSA